MKDFFINKKCNTTKLLDFGFKKIRQFYLYETFLMDKSFKLSIKISLPNKIEIKTIETETSDEYTLHLTHCEGSFVGKLRKEYEEVLEKVETKCFEPDLFRFSQTNQYIEFLKEKYNTDLEYLWEKFPDNAIARRKDNSKWFAAILTVKKEKLGFNSSEKVEVVDLRADINNVPLLLNQDNIYPAYHMNKKHWITIILDGSFDFKMLCKMTEDSYKLAK